LAYAQLPFRESNKSESEAAKACYQNGHQFHVERSSILEVKTSFVISKRSLAPFSRRDDKCKKFGF